MELVTNNIYHISDENCAIESHYIILCFFFFICAFVMNLEKIQLIEFIKICLCINNNISEKIIINIVVIMC